MQEETQLPLFGDPPSVSRRAADPIVAEGIDASVTDGFTAPAADPPEQPTPGQDGAHTDVAENARSLLALADISGIGYRVQRSASWQTWRRRVSHSIS